MSVNPHHNGQKFTDKSPENTDLSVKCVLITDKSAKNGTLSVNLNEILDRLVEQYCRLKKVVFIHRKLKNRTKSVANRPASFGFSFDSSKKRDFFPSLFTIIYARFFLTSPSPKNESKTARNPNPATGTFSSDPKAGYAFLLSLCKICCCAETSSSSCFVLSL